MTAKHFILATAGHVDHGKSALVEALTGTDPDRLPEEKARQITIDLGFAQLILKGPNEQRFHVGIVDVPGHEDFVRNMIAGVGSVDLALFVVAVDDGWMPQTEEHLQILTYLGVERAVIALTKSDVGDAGSIVAQIRERLRDTGFARAPIIRTSVRTSEGIENLKSALASEFANMQPQRDIGKPRLFIDRAFVLHGIGTIVTGTLTGGQLRRGQKIVVQPSNLETRVRSIQSHGRELEFAQSGMRTAINLPDVGVGDGAGQIKRGDVITIVDVGRASPTLVACLERSERLGIESPAARPLKNGSSVYVHHGTSRVAAKIVLLENGALQAGKKAIAQLKLASPILAFLGDRFVVRDASEQHTIAGGLVLAPDKGKFLDAKQQTLLAARALALDDVDLCVRSEIALRGFARRETLLSKSHFGANEIGDAFLRLRNGNEIFAHGDLAVESEFWKKLRNQAIAVIEKAHKRNPDRAGFDLRELRTGLRDQRPDVFEALIVDLCTDNFVRKGSVISRTAHRPALPVEFQSVETKVREALSKKPFDPLPCREIELDRNAQRVLRFLIESGEVIEIASDVVLLRENFERMKNAVADFISKNGPATVSELRQALESSRRIMVPFLEKLDRQGVTRRIGDKRVLA
ncbi:MAG: selenocysteine-specific translation elongation factor [Verrucomicrobia bacterium]|nr:MAG: selenocysteine-specific translation elongation factor [Verrucomicrobiota bacterium]